MNSLTTDAMAIAPAVAVGDPLPRRAVHHDGGDVGTLGGGFGRGLLGAAVKAVEGCGGLVGRGFGQRGQRPLRGDDGQLRRIGVHRRRAVDPGLTTGQDQTPLRSPRPASMAADA